MSCTCHIHVMYMSYTCHIHAIYMSYRCQIHVIYVSYTCHVHVIYMSCTCHWHVMYMSYTCHVHVMCICMSKLRMYMAYFIHHIMSSYHRYIHSAIVIHSLVSEIVCAPTNLMFYRRNHMLFFPMWVCRTNYYLVNHPYRSHYSNPPKDRIVRSYLSFVILLFKPKDIEN
jgi:hypothetical protein